MMVRMKVDLFDGKDAVVRIKPVGGTQVTRARCALRLLPFRAPFITYTLQLPACPADGARLTDIDRMMKAVSLDTATKPAEITLGYVVDTLVAAKPQLVPSVDAGMEHASVGDENDVIACEGDLYKLHHYGWITLALELYRSAFECAEFYDLWAFLGQYCKRLSARQCVQLHRAMLVRTADGFAINPTYSDCDVIAHLRPHTLSHATPVARLAVAVAPVTRRNRSFFYGRTPYDLAQHRDSESILLDSGQLCVIAGRETHCLYGTVRKPLKARVSGADSLVPAQMHSRQETLRQRLEAIHTVFVAGTVADCLTMIDEAAGLERARHAKIALAIGPSRAGYAIRKYNIPAVNVSATPNRTALGGIFGGLHAAQRAAMARAGIPHSIDDGVVKTHYIMGSADMATIEQLTFVALRISEEPRAKATLYLCGCPAANTLWASIYTYYRATASDRKRRCSTVDCSPPLVRGMPSYHAGLDIARISLCAGQLFHPDLWHAAGRHFGERVRNFLLIFDGIESKDVYRTSRYDNFVPGAGTIEADDELVMDPYTGATDTVDRLIQRAHVDDHSDAWQDLTGEFSTAIEFRAALPINIFFTLRGEQTLSFGGAPRWHNLHTSGAKRLSETLLSIDTDAMHPHDNVVYVKTNRSSAENVPRLSYLALRRLLVIDIMRGSSRG
jgi:hypothetical protein